MIYLNTGLPGSGKTLYVLDKIEKLRRDTGRTVYYVKRDPKDDLAPGISGLNLPWVEIQPSDWPSCEPNSVIVIDECQKVEGFRPRSPAVSPPSWAEPAMETHRSKGLDLYLICQHPTQLALGIRRLVNYHFHSRRMYGMQKSRIFEWQGCKDNCDKSTKDAIEHFYNFNKVVYDYYKSAEVHTVKRRIPFRVWLFFSLPFFLFLSLYYFYSNFIAPKKKDPVTLSPAAMVASSDPDVQYASFVPRISGLPHTAPAYDTLTLPVEAPYPKYCISLGSRYCRCYTQRSTYIEVPDITCQSIAARGFFAYWIRDDPRGQPDESRVQSRRDADSFSPVASSPMP